MNELKLLGYGRFVVQVCQSRFRLVRIIQVDLFEASVCECQTPMVRATDSIPAYYMFKIRSRCCNDTRCEESKLTRRSKLVPALFGCHKFAFCNHSNRFASFIIQRVSLLTSHGLSSSYCKSNQMMADPVANGVTFSFAIFLELFPGDCQHFNSSCAPEWSTQLNRMMAFDQRVNHSESTDTPPPCLFVCFINMFFNLFISRHYVALV